MTAAPERMKGVLTPVITPFDDRLNPDLEHLAAQCRWLLTQQVGLAVFGTNSEANSLSADEKIELLDGLVASGIDPGKMMPGTGACALTDAVRLSAHAAGLGCGGTLVLPPFYYKSVSDDGLFRFYAELIERVGDDRLRIYLYHIPPIAKVGLSVQLIERLVRRFPDTIVGIKDSSGDWSNTANMLERQWSDFRVFVGSESFLLQNMRNGGAGCISATANVNPSAIHNLYENWDKEHADHHQAQLNDLRNLVMEYPMIPALKSVVTHFSHHEGWRRVRPPLVQLDDSQHDDLISRLTAHGFSMPGL